MISLIRHRNSATNKVHDIKLSTATLTIGSGLDQQLLISRADAAHRHARIRSSRGEVKISTVGRNKMLVNGEYCRHHALQPGDEIRIGEQTIRVVAAPEGFDFACEFTSGGTPQRISLADSWHREIHPGVWTSRRLAYCLTVVIVFVAFWLPYKAYLEGVDTVKDEPWQDLISAIAQTQQQPWRADSLWSPGPLLGAHQNAIGNDCTSCHTQPFQPVGDEACATCHRESVQHFANPLLAETPHSLDSGSTVAGSALNGLLEPASSALTSFGYATEDMPRCESCHKEHNQPQSLIATTDQLCTQCHRDALLAPSGDVTPVATAFNASQHPQFRYSFLEAVHETDATSETAGVSIPWVRTSQTDLSVAIEESNLEFSHEIHLQLDEPTLDCSSCHQLDTDKEHFVAINMQDHCTECHKLEFNEREIPHGDPALAIRSIEEYFIALYVTPGRNLEAQPRRLPGRLERRCEGSDFECAVEKAEQEIELQFGTSGCVTCHQVTSIENTALVGSDGWTGLSQSWRVEPVHINSDWYVDARFDHEAHLGQAGLTERELCSGCHRAEASGLSADVLIPKIETCLGCHGDSNSNGKMRAECSDCHLHHSSHLASEISARNRR